MGISKNNAVSYKGTITESADFPSTSIRKDGMTYCVNVDVDITDPFMMTDVSLTTSEGKGTEGADITVYTHASHATNKIVVLNAAYATLTVGSQVKINGEIRYVTVVDTVNITISAALTTAIPSGTPIVFDYKVASGTCYVNAYHQSEVAEHYGEMTGSNTLFTTELAIGDVIKIEGSNEIRQVSAIDSNTTLHVDTLFTGTISAKKIYKKNTTTGYYDELIGTVSKHANHNTKTNAEYKKVYGNFSTFSVGDILVIVTTTGTWTRKIESIVSTTHCYVTLPLTGSIANIDTVGEAKAFTVIQTANKFVNGGSHDNKGRVIMWMTSATDVAEWITLEVGTLN
jgi:hypothetical protein